MPGQNNAKTPESEIKTRISRFQTRMAEQDIDAALIVQNTDLFYFSGTLQQSHLFIPQSGEALLMVKKDLKRAKTESPLKNIASINSSKEIPDLLKAAGDRKSTRLNSSHYS